uniref:Uncharacterized protein n=2 Tax=Helianthus annuus TaxID=4232 RepID=A0A251TVK8_HELAN
MLLMLTIVLLVLLAVGIFSLPIGSDDDDSSFYPHDRIMFKRKQLLVKTKGSGKCLHLCQVAY